MEMLCPHCGFVCEEGQFKVHIVNNCQPTVQCEQCSEHFANSTALLNHTRAKHNREFQCDICQKDFISKSNLQRHQAMAHQKLPEGKSAIKELKCQVCDKSFFQKWLLERHIRGEHNKQFTCPLCRRECASQHSLRGHLISVHPNEHKEKNGTLLSCQHCNKQFTGNWYLQRHIRSKHIKEFTCHLCEKVCSSEIVLNRHLEKRHSQVEEDLEDLFKKKWKCSQCELRFKYSWVLKRHIEGKHERKFKCDICNETLAGPFPLSRHKKFKHGIDTSTKRKKTEELVQDNKSAQNDDEKPTTLSRHKKIKHGIDNGTKRNKIEEVLQDKNSMQNDGEKPTTSQQTKEIDQEPTREDLDEFLIKEEFLPF